MKSKQTYTCRIWIAGDYDDACRAVKEFCEEGACFAVAPVNYIYTRGSEVGVCVTRINYARFPVPPDVIFNQCERLAHHMMLALFQDSFSIEAPDRTVYISRKSATP